MVQMYSRDFSIQVDILPENGYILLMLKVSINIDW